MEVGEWIRWFKGCCTRTVFRVGGERKGGYVLLRDRSRSVGGKKKESSD